MNTPNKGLGRRLVAALGATTIGLIGLAGAASAAVGPDQTDAPTSGTLTINKYGGLPVDQGGNTTNPLTGVEFTVTQVGRLEDDNCVAIDLTDAADWAGLDGNDGLFASQPATPADPFCLTDVTQADTTENGSVQFDLAVGVYYVEETDSGDNPIVSPVPNFYVSIPTSDSDEEGGWNYNVVADPKNQLQEEPTKTITERPDALVVGSKVTWELTIPIPDIADGETFDNGSVTDKLDSRLGYASSTVKIGDTVLNPGTDYTIDSDGVTWTFETTVLDAHQGEDITIELVTTVNSVGDGAIANAGGEDGNYWSEFNNSRVPGGTTPYTYWGKLAINKTDDSTTKSPLAGAEFKVFEKAADVACAAKAPETGAVATGTSDATGVVQWEDVSPVNELGLWIQNSADGPLTNPTKEYCVYETVIPAGHTATAINNPVTISASETALTLDVVNPKTPGPHLPLTGANGQLLALIGGGALVLLASGTALVARKRSHENQD